MLPLADGSLSDFPRFFERFEMTQPFVADAPSLSHHLGTGTGHANHSFLLSKLKGRQFPGIAMFAVEPPVRLGVLDELPTARIPTQLAMVPIGQIAEMANRH